MNAPNQIEGAYSLGENRSGLTRRSFLRTATFAGATSLAALGGLVTVAAAEKDDDPESMKFEHNHLKKDDRTILGAAEIADRKSVV